jgi:hypothetical protein
MLNALVLIFDGVCLRKMFGFINLLLKLNMYVSSSRCNRFKDFKNVTFSFVLKCFLNSKTFIACYCKYFLLKGKFSFNSSGFNIVVLLMGGKG